MSKPITPKGQETHERIVRTAARAIRRDGYDGVSVADIMKEAGLTHGGFYAHFPSRDALLVEAMALAGQESLASLEAAAAKAPDGRRLDAMVDRYLSDAHADAPERGCSLAALGSETRRQSPELRAAATERVEHMLDLIAAELPATKQRREDAMAALSTMVGALVISRLVDKKKLGHAFREAAKKAVKTTTTESP